MGSLEVESECERKVFWARRPLMAAAKASFPLSMCYVGTPKHKEKTMRRRSSISRVMTLACTCGFLWGFGGGCLPDNLFVNTAGEIVKGLIISGVNTALSDAGLEI